MNRAKHQRQKGKGCAKSAVMQPEYRMRVVQDKKKYNRKAKEDYYE